MAMLTVSGDYLIRPEPGSPPGGRVEWWLVISVMREDGTPKQLPFEDPPSGHQPVDVELVLSGKFGASIGLGMDIVEIEDLGGGLGGFYALRLESQTGDTTQGDIDSLRPSVLKIVVDDGTDRGQALACSCGAATVAEAPGID